MKRIETRQPVCEEFGININKAGTGFELGNGIHFIMEINKNLKRFVFFFCYNLNERRGKVHDKLNSLVQLTSKEHKESKIQRVQLEICQHSKFL